ncbi:MAG: hypothetical protein A2W22_00970 [Candidatus Levybacteria bacterium RBG_16_35_11]|nr:MAG: hypothetical protein A2W22_00970 [Candidatus Levybacteria bacterium RBG_16_35_11]
MKYSNRLVKIYFLFSVFYFLFYLFPKMAYAYIDLGTGSYILQILIATLLGAIVTLRTFWTKIKTFFINLFLKNKNNTNK